ncbi:MAG: hypothetical protein HY537_01535 [Deltaproteobacteria bacterium]|nr:hypothetical protein [Deltaproteobacteria bacterium]
MDSEQKPKQRNKHPDHVTLCPEALTRLGTWASELGERLKGTRITKHDLVNFLILSHTSQLTEKEVSDLSAKHFDEVRFAEWALKQLKESKAQGKSLSLSEIMSSVKKSDGDSVQREVPND